MKIAESLAELPDQETVLSMSGLEFMEGIRDGTISVAPIAMTTGFHLHSVEKGRVVYRGAPGFSVMNPVGTIHGGWYGTILDSAMACAVMTMVPRGSVYTTLEYKISIIRPIPLDVLVECEGVIDHAGRSTGVAHGEIRGVENGKLYATGTTTCIIMKMG